MSGFFCFLFVLVVWSLNTGLMLARQALYHLSHSAVLSLLLVIFQIKVLCFLLSQPHIVIFLIFASQVAGITGMSCYSWPF
jgi:hypothetical protein